MRDSVKKPATLDDAYRLIRPDRATRESRTVLVVEDDMEMLSSVAEVIREEGYQALTAGNGWQALSVLAEREVALILLDLMMPQMNGWELVARVREARPQVPVVLISATPNLEEEVRRLQADGCLRKPFRLDDVIRVVNEYCS